MCSEGLRQNNNVVMILNKGDEYLIE